MVVGFRRQYGLIKVYLSGTSPGRGLKAEVGTLLAHFSLPRQGKLIR